MEFTANIGEDTKTQLTEGTKVMWCAEDAIAVSDGTKVEKYTVKELRNDGKSAIFQGAALEGDTFYAVYPYAEDAAYTDGKWNVTIPTKQGAVAGSFADGAALAYGEYQGDYTFSFTNENAVLKFQVPENCSFVQFYNESNLAVELNGGLTAGETYYAAVAPGEYTFVVRIDACPSKTSTKELLLERNTIYNLGTLPAKQTKTVYLAPGVWASDNADFAVYFWNGSSDNDLLMTKDTTKNGVYKAEVAADAEGIIFKRLNPADHQEWNKTGDLTLPADEKDHYYVTGWGATDGEWREYVQTQWALCGSSVGWDEVSPEANYMERISASVSVKKNITLPAYAEIKVKKAESWDGSYGAGEWNRIIPGKYLTAYNGSSTNFAIATTDEAEYDVYFDEKNERIYVVVAGTDYTTATEQTENGPEQIAVELAATNITETTATITITSNGATVKYLKVDDDTEKTFDDVISNGTDVTLTNGVYTMNLTGLTANTTYYYYAAAKDENGEQEVLSSRLEFKTLEAGEEVVDNNLYLTPNANWKQANARFAAYFFGNGEKWVSMTDSNADGVYEVAKQEGYPNVIFCRMNPGAVANNWTNKWNQTADLAIPTDGTNHYTVKEDTWDKGGGTWSTYTPAN